MPKYGQQQDEGTVVRWLKEEGDQVVKGEVLAELETDKASFDFEAPEAGFIRKIVAAEGAVVPVLSVIAILTETAEEPFDPDAVLPAAKASDTIMTMMPDAPSSSAAVGPGTGGGARLKSSPAAKKLARKLGVDLATVQGTGPGGRITSEDVEQAAFRAPAALGSADRSPLSNMRQAIGRAMSKSKQTIPHFYVGIEVDMTDAEAWRKDVSAGRGIKLSVTDVLIKAAAATLTQYPVLNASLDGDAMVEHAAVNIGLAVGLEDGLLVPVIADAHDRFLPVVAKERAEVVEAARRGKISGTPKATFTISNLGMFGVTSFIAIVNPPECAALAVGAILPRLRPHGEPPENVMRQVMQITLSADHRLADGMLAARYLHDLKQKLQSVEMIEEWM